MSRATARMLNTGSSQRRTKQTDEAAAPTRSGVVTETCVKWPPDLEITPSALNIHVIMVHIIAKLLRPLAAFVPCNSLIDLRHAPGKDIVSGSYLSVPILPPPILCGAAGEFTYLRWSPLTQICFAYELKFARRQLVESIESPHILPPSMTSDIVAATEPLALNLYCSFASFFRDRFSRVFHFR